MKKILKKINTKYCRFVFIISLILGFFMVQKTLFVGSYTILGILFVISFAMTVTCLVKNIKEKIQIANKEKKSIIGIIGAVIGVSAAQVCGVNAMFCGSTIGVGLLSTILPASAVGFLSEYAVSIIILSIITQIIGLYFMKCFK
ncbi:MAG TPA: hypothetical protein VJ892_00170 [Candidatus Absconditabacterales bacterium]|nr:hypothetical protein [Candidatus Absconditabacterales bacterium]